jgi:hypothetical protein
VAGQPVGARPGADTRTEVVARLISIDTVANKAVVSVDGSQPIALPYNPAAVYTGYNTVMCLRNPIEGRVTFVMCPIGTQAAAPLPAPPIPAPPATVTATATIFPTTSATWSAKYSRYSAWQPTRYGGTTTMYQGDKYGSGVLTGIAVYGDQIVNLGATSILSMTVGVTIVTPDTGTPQLRGTASGSIAAAMRTGAVKGLILTGGTYLGVYGAANSGMALSITYTRPG